MWAEYHIYDGPSELGRTFPGKKFQSNFFRHLDTVFKVTPWSVSIDAADESMTPLETDNALVALKFGLFDDSFLNADMGGYNTDCWNFFNRNRFLTSPAGGEFSYYNDNDQKNALAANGPNGLSFAVAAKQFHISYMIGADQLEYQTIPKIKEASRRCGYAFEVTRCATTSDSAEVTVRNYGVAPLYYDAFVAVNGVRSSTSLRLLAPDSSRICRVAAGGTAPKVTIECDRLVPGQKIEYLANLTGASVKLPKNTPLTMSKNGAKTRQFLLDGRVVDRKVSAHTRERMSSGAAGVFVSEEGGGRSAVHLINRETKK